MLHPSGWECKCVEWQRPCCAASAATAIELGIENCRLSAQRTISSRVRNGVMHELVSPPTRTDSNGLRRRYPTHTLRIAGLLSGLCHFRAVFFLNKFGWSCSISVFLSSQGTWIGCNRNFVTTASQSGRPGVDCQLSERSSLWLASDAGWCGLMSILPMCLCSRPLPCSNDSCTEARLMGIILPPPF